MPPSVGKIADELSELEADQDRQRDHEDYNREDTRGCFPKGRMPPPCVANPRFARGDVRHFGTVCLHVSRRDSVGQVFASFCF